MLKLSGIGRLGTDPEYRFTPNGQAVTTFSVAFNNRRGGKEEETTWVRASAFSKLAEICNQYLHKGSQVYLEGRPRLHTYEGRDGQSRTNLEMVVNEMQMLGGVNHSDVPDENTEDLPF